VALLREGQTPVLGAIENMSAVECPHCGNEFEVFLPARAQRPFDLGDRVECLGRIPLSPVVAETAEQGRPLVLSHPQSRGGTRVLRDRRASGRGGRSPLGGIGSNPS
jgi:ATP-binding protein involved in chromosome partitioning